MIKYNTMEIAPDEGYKKCPEFWDKEYAEKYAKLWQTMNPETEIYSAGNPQSLDHECGMTDCTERTEKQMVFEIKYKKY